MKKYAYVFIFVLLLIGLTACGSTATISNTTTEIQQSTDWTTNIQETTIISTESNTTTTNQPTLTIQPTTVIETSTDKPTTQEPITQEETTTVTEITTVQPTTQAPTTIQPTTQVPTTVLPTTQAPTTTEVTTIHYVTINFVNMDGASGTMMMEGISGNPYSMPENPSKNGYVFDGFFIDSNFETPFNITVYPENDLTVYVKWIELISITFEPMNGSTTKPIVVGISGDTFQMPDDPMRNGYVFDGWYLDQMYNTPFMMTTIPESDISVYAKWVEEVTIIDEMVQVLENDFGFTCSNNICVLEEYSWRVYTFNLNTVTFLMEENITDDDDPNFYKNEWLEFDHNWNVEYIIEESVGSTSMRLTGNAQNGTYSFTRFSSSIYEQDDYYDDMVNIIQGGQYTSGLVGFIEAILETAQVTMDDLKNQ